LNRPICGSDWDRLRLYAPLVKKLTSGYDNVTLTKIFPALSLSLPETILQNLQTLIWYHCDDFHFIHIFLRPTLTTIFFDIDSVSASSLLSTLTQKCPKLIDISISSTTGDNNMLYLSRFVCGLQFAEALYVPSLDHHALDHISRLPTLNSLSIGALPRTLIVSPESGTQKFSGLRDLSLDCPQIGPTIQFLTMFIDVPLHTFRLSFEEFFSAAETHTLFERIASGISHSTLTDLNTYNDGDWDNAPNAATYMIPGHSIRLLRCFRNLTTLFLTTPVGFDLDNETVADMARAWPQIQTLHLAGRFSGSDPHATLTCLHSFARYCPHLTDLGIPFDATAVPAPSEVDPRTYVR
jgi:hypothetical protein